GEVALAHDDARNHQLRRLADRAGGMDAVRVRSQVLPVDRIARSPAEAGAELRLHGRDRRENGIGGDDTGHDEVLRRAPAARAVASSVDEGVKVAHAAGRLRGVNYPNG
ncbi:MAG: hypothetical protein ACRD0D_13960, partial [Acidimicrobiales bacterium]